MQYLLKPALGLALTGFAPFGIIVPYILCNWSWGLSMAEFVRRFWAEDQGQDIAEYAVMLAVILVIVVGTLRVIGSNSNGVFSSVASSVQ